EGAALAEPPHLFDGRCHRDLPLPCRHPVRPILLRRSHRSLRGGDRPGPRPHRKLRLASNGRYLAMVNELHPAKPDLAEVRRETGIIRESLGYRVFRVANVTLLLLVCAVTLYPFAN